MAKKRGQPPKLPDEKRERITLYISPSEKEEVEEARLRESPERRTGAYIRDVAIEYCRQVNAKK
ncbi:MAG: hypothetical protein FWC50_03105 [Planctomycetaceae bacterium]|nr:hypothetical protein [Planctomycetaceae bacterium]